MYPINNEVQQIQEIKKEPYSVTREVNGKKFVSKSYGSDGIIRYDYEDESAIIFDLYNKVMYLTDCNNEIISTEKPTKKYDLDLLENAIYIFKSSFTRE